MLQRIATPNNFLVLLLVVSAFISNFAEANNAPTTRGHDFRSSVGRGRDRRHG